MSVRRAFLRTSALKCSTEMTWKPDIELGRMISEEVRSGLFPSLGTFWLLTIFRLLHQIRDLVKLVGVLL